MSRTDAAILRNRLIDDMLADGVPVTVVGRVFRVDEIEAVRLRDKLICKLRADGTSAPKVAEIFGLTPKRIRQIMRLWK